MFAQPCGAHCPAPKEKGAHVNVASREEKKQEIIY